LVRAATCIALAEVRKTSIRQILNEHWPDDHIAALIVRGAVSPTTRTDYPGNSLTGVLNLAPRSASSRLFAQAAAHVDLTGASSFSFPLAGISAVAKFCGEGQPIPVLKGNFTGMAIGPTRKLAMIGALTAELEVSSAYNASIAIERILEDSIGRGLDSVLLGNGAADAIQPAGLLNGLDAIPATSGGGSNAMARDLGAIVSAISLAGIDPESVAFIVNPMQATTVRLVAGPQFHHPIIGSAAVEAGTVVGVGTSALVVAGSDTIKFSTSKETLVHMDDAPLPIGEVGTPATVAAPSRSMWQTDSFSLRSIADITWSIAPGAVAYVEEASWP
jgi:hypothetical protein